MIDEKDTVIEENQDQVSLNVEEIVDDVPDFLNDTPKIVYHITDFDGPIELLYQLIKDAKIAIEDLFISEVTGQYVEIIRNTPKEELDYDYAAEFVSLAAELIYLKSDKSLPIDDFDEEDPLGPEYERQRLILKIKEYEIMQQEVEKLRKMETTNRFYREPTYSEKDYRVALINFSLDKLVEAYANILVKSEISVAQKMERKIERERFSVHDQMLSIKDRIKDEKNIEFNSLFEETYDKIDIVTTFLAVLELLKYGVITVEQDETFGNITIYASEDIENAQIDFVNEDEDGKY